MATYEIMKVYTLQNERPEHEMTFFENARNGAVAGGVASLATNPIDVIKTRMMVNREACSATMYRTTLDLLSDEGLAGFFKGCHIRVASVSFASVLFFSIYEPSKIIISSNLIPNEFGLH